MPVGARFIPARIGENKKMTEHKKLQPEIRFAGFTDDWEQRKLGEVVNVLDNLRIPIAASQRLEGVTPYYGANGIQGYIDGFTHDGEFVLVAEDGANDLINYPVQYVSGKVWINNHAHVLQGIKNVANNLFLVYRIKSMDMTKYLVGGGRTKLNASVMKDIELHLPNYAEQTQIGNFFKQLDDTIALHQGTLEKYQKLKVSYLEKMFPKENELYPELRFPNFTDAWEQRKLGEFVSSLRSGLSRMLDSEDIGLPVIRANNINNGYVDLENDIKYWYQIDPMGANTRNYLVAKDDILINFINSESRMGSAAIMRSIPSRDTIYTTNILRLRLTSDLDPYWFYIQTQSKLYLEYIKSISKVAVNQASFTTVEFKNFTFFCPSTKEQTQIGNFFKQLDDTIALHQREVEKYKKIKQSYLEKMFI